MAGLTFSSMKRFFMGASTKKRRPSRKGTRKRRRH